MCADLSDGSVSTCESPPNKLNPGVQPYLEVSKMNTKSNEGYNNDGRHLDSYNENNSRIFL